MAKMETGQGVWFDQHEGKSMSESLQTAYSLYVQYPTSHMPSQQAQTPPPNQPKLSNKHPVMHLNELKSNLVYDILKNEAEDTEGQGEGVKQETEMDQTEDGKEGEVEKKKKKKTQTTYTCTVKVDGDVFSGTAKSQKLAKQEAAKYALLKKFNILFVPGYENMPDDVNIFTGGKRKNPEKQGGGPNAKKQKNPNIPKNALMVLNEKKPGLQYNVTSQTGPVHAPTFIISVDVDGQVFEGSGNSKKTARLSAAQNACKVLNYEYTA